MKIIAYCPQCGKGTQHDVMVQSPDMLDRMPFGHCTKCDSYYTLFEYHAADRTALVYAALFDLIMAVSDTSNKIDQVLGFGLQLLSMPIKEVEENGS